MSGYAVCADVGSTRTKVLVVDLSDGAVVGAASAPTTVGSDVLAGLDAAVAAATVGLAASGAASWYVCSSAGGGLRLAVVGYEELVTAEAGRRVGLSAGARVVHVAAGRLDAAAVARLRAARPDVVLLVGGTDGGDGEVLVHNAGRLARARWRVPVVLAGNADVREAARVTLAGAGFAVTAAENVLPRIGVLCPEPARAAIRRVFLRHVIGGKRLSRGRRFPDLVRAATPDAVLSGVGVLADRTGGDLLVVDVGGATTDVYSALTADERAAGAAAPAAGVWWRSRTVEGDLGVRWSAPDVVRAAVAERMIDEEQGRGLAAPAAARAAEPGLLVSDAAGWGVERRLAGLAATLAVRRHARGAGGRDGRDLRDVRLVVGSGGVFRHDAGDQARAVLAGLLADHGGGWPVPRAARVVVDGEYVLAAAGLLAAEQPVAAAGLLARLVDAAV